MSRDLIVDLLRDVADVRDRWLSIERRADDLLDERLDSEIQIAWCGIATTYARLDELVWGGDPAEEALVS